MLPGDIDCNLPLRVVAAVEVDGVEMGDMLLPPEGAGAAAPAVTTVVDVW